MIGKFSNVFPAKGPIVNILGFMGHKAFVTANQLSHGSTNIDAV